MGLNLQRDELLHEPEIQTGDHSLAGTQRLIAVDIVRGLAIAGVVLFHLVWDFEFTGIISGVAQHPAWLMFGRSLAGTFMILVGVSLVLAHRTQIRWSPFMRRLSIIALAAAAVTIMTYLVFPASFVYFGILHAIAAATLIGALFIRAPASLCLAAGTAIFALPFFYESTAFDTRLTAWIGFFTQPPPSNDFVPIFPWVGLTLFGMAATKWLLTFDLERYLSRSAPQGQTARFLAWCGRTSLVIYLVHQPVLLAVIVPVSRLLT